MSAVRSLMEDGIKLIEGVVIEDVEQIEDVL